MELTHEEIRFQFINSIMKENKVSLKSVYECLKGNTNDIYEMGSIFNSHDEVSVKKRMVLLHLVSRNQAEENLKFYRDEINYKQELIESDIAKYKTILIAALLEDTIFFAKACNWCGIIRQEIENASRIKPFKLIDRREAGYVTLVFPQAVHKYAASGTGENFSEFFKNTFAYEGIGGTLRFMGNGQSQVYLEFIFDEFQNIIPFEIELCFITRQNNREHKIPVPADEEHRTKDREMGITIIRSDIISDVDYSGGIEANYNVNLKLKKDL